MSILGNGILGGQAPGGGGPGGLAYTQDEKTKLGGLFHVQRFRYDNFALLGSVETEHTQRIDVHDAVRTDAAKYRLQKAARIQFRAQAKDLPGQPPQTATATIDVKSLDGSESYLVGDPPTHNITETSSNIEVDALIPDGVSSFRVHYTHESGDIVQLNHIDGFNGLIDFPSTLTAGAGGEAGVQASEVNFVTATFDNGGLDRVPVSVNTTQKFMDWFRGRSRVVSTSQPFAFYYPGEGNIELAANRSGPITYLNRGNLEWDAVRRWMNLSRNTNTGPDSVTGIGMDVNTDNIAGFYSRWSYDSSQADKGEWAYKMAFAGTDIPAGNVVNLNGGLGVNFLPHGGVSDKGRVVVRWEDNNVIMSHTYNLDVDLQENIPIQCLAMLDGSLLSVVMKYGTFHDWIFQDFDVSAWTASGNIYSIWASQHLSVFKMGETALGEPNSLLDHFRMHPAGS